MPISEPFRPAMPLKSPFLQTILASSGLRTIGDNPMASNSRKIIFKTPDNIRLVGYYSPHTAHVSNGLVILLNGWQGDVNSAYVLRTGKHLYRNGYSVLRLNYRDHGDSHHLNEGLFYATLLEEVFQCVSQAAEIENSRPVFLAGFSLGGNFALRIARKCVNEQINHLKHIVCISPALDPDKSTDAIDDNKIIQSYFLKKWTRSLLKKQTLFPDIYNFTDILKKRNIRIMTELLIKRYTLYENAEHYFSEYAIKKDDLINVTIPTTIITAEDDPIIPIEDFYHLKLNSMTNLVIHRYGGHNGFLEGIRLGTWYERAMVEVFDGILKR